MKKLWALLSLVCALMIGTAGATTVNGIGTALGFSGEITVMITLADGVITNVQIDHNDTPAIVGDAVEILPERIKESNSLNVDVIAGATLTSKAILEAAKNALLSAGLDPNDYGYTENTTPDTPAEPDDNISNIPAGAYTGTAVGMSGKVTVGITLNGTRIAAVYVDHNDTPAIVEDAVEMLPERIVASNSLNVDVVAGATVTSKAILEAAKNALLSAGLDPDDYMVKADQASEPGDSDGDGSVTINDAIAMLQYCVGENANVDLEAADVTDDGKVDVQDVLRVLQYNAGWNVKLQ